MTPLIVYKRTEEKELTHPKNLLQHPFFRNIYGQKRKNLASSEDTSTNLL
jgi:hypothetical protein